MLSKLSKIEWSMCFDENVIKLNKYKGWIIPALEIKYLNK